MHNIPGMSSGYPNTGTKVLDFQVLRSSAKSKFSILYLSQKIINHMHVKSSLLGK